MLARRLSLVISRVSARLALNSIHSLPELNDRAPERGILCSDSCGSCPNLTFKGNHVCTISESKAVTASDEKTVVNVCALEPEELNHFSEAATTATSVVHMLEAQGWGLDTAMKLQKFVGNITPDVVLDVVRQLKNAQVALAFLSWASDQEGYEQKAEAFTKIVGRLGRERDFASAWQLLHRMKRQGLEVNYAFSIFIHRLIRAKMVDQVVEALHSMESLNVIPTVPLYTSSLQLLLKANKLGQAQRLYHQMLQNGLIPDKKLYEILIVGFSRAGKLDAALLFLKEMKKQRYVPHRSIYSSLICSLSMIGRLDDGHKLYLETTRNSSLPNVFTHHELACALHGENTMQQVDRFLEVVERKAQNLKIHSHNNLLQYLFDIGKCDEAMHVFHAIPGNKHKPDGNSAKQLMRCHWPLNSYEVFLLGICKVGHLMHALAIFREMLESGPKPSGRICSCLLHCLSNAKMIDEALELCDHIVKLKMPICNDAQLAFFTALRVSGRLGRACKVFLAMRRKRCIDEESDFVSLVGMKT